MSSTLLVNAAEGRFVGRALQFLGYAAADRSSVFPGAAPRHGRQGARRRPPRRGRRPALPDHAAHAPPRAGWPTRSAGGCTATSTYFNVNRHINPTNVCVYTYNCKFCSFAALHGEDHAWEMSHEDVYRTPAEQGGNRVTEFHIVGGLHPDLSLDWYLEMLRGLKERFPNAHLKAFTAIEIGWFAKREKISIEEVLTPPARRRPGLAARAAAPRSSTPRCARSSATASSTPTSGSRSTAPPTAWASRPTAPCSTATSSGPSTRSTTCCACATCRTRRGGFNAFIPLAFHPENNYMGLQVPHHRASTTCATSRPSRLVLDNIPHIKAYWVMLSPSWPRWRSRFGADDLDGTVVEEKIYHMAGAEHRAGADPRRARADRARGRLRPGRARHALQRDPRKSADSCERAPGMIWRRRLATAGVLAILGVAALSTRVGNAPPHTDEITYMSCTLESMFQGTVFPVSTG